MVDIHHHLLPGLDDGSKDMETSVAMVKMAADDGITHVVCTPHANGKYGYDRARIEELADELRGKLARDGVAVTIGVGCDFHLSYDNVQDALTQKTFYTINRLGYLLIELPDYGLPRGLSETFYQLRVAGMTPILTHPERNPTLQAEMGKLEEWMRGGLLVQVTANSVTGGMGRKAERAAHDLLSKKWVHFLATDAHNLTSRPPKMSEARRVVEKKYGVEYARALCVDNPLAVFEGKHLPVADDLDDVYAEKKERGWMARLFGR